MAKFVATPEELAKMRELRAGIHVVLNKDEENRKTYEASLVDQLTKKRFASFTADTEEEACRGCIKKANPEDRPKTPAELVSENEQLKTRLAELERQPGAGAQTIKGGPSEPSSGSKRKTIKPPSDS